MSVLNDTAVIAKELAELAAEKTAKVVETQKLRLAVLKTKNQLQKQYQALGKTYYMSIQTDHPQEEQLSLLVDHIEQTKAQLADLKQQLQAKQKQ